MKKAIWMLVAAPMAFGMMLNTSSALPQFKTAWDKTYMTEGSAMYTALEGKSNCNVCHVGPKDRKMKNDYGKALDALLSKDDKGDAAKIAEAFKTVEAEKAPGGETFGELIKTGKLPITK